MRRTSVAASTLAVIVALVAGTPAHGARTRYLPLSAAGVSVSGATLTGRDLVVTVRLRRPVAIRLAMSTATPMRGYGKGLLRKGSHVMRARLSRVPAATRMTLQVTVLMPGGRRARGTVRVKVVVRGTGGPGQPVTTTTTTTTTTPPGPTPTTTPTTPAPAADRPPTDITLTPSAVAENQPTGTTVGTLVATDPDAGDTPTFSLVSGDGAADNALFAIDGATLRTAATFDYETRSSYSVRVRADDGRGAAVEKVLPIAIVDANDAPTAIALSASTVPENQLAGTTVGALSATDADAADTHTFALVPGTGSTDNASFTVQGGALRTAASFDFETKASYAVRIGVDDGHGGTFEQPFTITVTDVDDPPVLSTTSAALPYTEGDPATVVDPGLTVSDIDSATLAGATVAIGTGQQVSDELAFTDQNGITGSFDAVSGVLTLTGSASVGDYQAALRSVTYRNTGDAPQASKTVSFSASDGTATSTAASRTIVVTAVDDSPVVTTAGGTTLTYAENDPATPIDAQLTVADVDSAQLAGATVAITANFAPAQDVLRLSDQNGISGSWDGATGVLTLTGAATPAAYQAALRSVAYVNTSDSPSTLTRTVTFQVTDSAFAVSGLATDDVSVAAANDPPTANADAASTDEDTPLSVSAPGVLGNDTDPDVGDTQTVVALNGSATLSGTSAKGAAVTIAPDGAYTYDPGSLFQGLATGQQDTDTFTYTMADGSGAQSSATVTMTITGVSDAPTPSDDSYDAVGNTGLFVGTSKPAGQAGRELSGSLLDNDTDPDTPTAALVTEPVTGEGTALGGVVTIGTDGTFAYLPPTGTTGTTDSFTYRVCDASPCDSTTVANATATAHIALSGRVWYVRNTAGPGGTGTSASPFAALADAQTASGAGDTTYVFAGDGTSSGLDSGYQLDPGEQLVGEAAGLSLDPDGGGPLPTMLLDAGSASARPLLSAPSGGEVVTLASAAGVSGIAVDPPQSGGGISGGAAVSGAGISDVVVDDAGATGSRPGIDLDSTTGTFAISNTTITTSGAEGVRLASAGTVNVGPDVSVTATGARALDATSTDMGTSSFATLTVSGSPDGGVRLANTTGATTLTSVSLTTAGSAAAALDLANAGTVTVGGGTVDAGGGPAVSLIGTPAATVDLGTASSTDSTSDGITVSGLGSGSFTATGGTITGAAGTAVVVAQGSGDVTYGGTLGDGPGATAQVSNRQGGTVTLGGAIADGPDSGGGILVSGNSGGTTVLDGPSKILQTGTGDGIDVSSNAGAALTISGGGLAVTTTSGAGLDATGGGTVTVSGSGNTIDTTTGRALRITSTDIGGAGVTFQRISANGAPNGILVDTTGTSGGLTVTGNGGACVGAPASCSGGQIAAAAGADSSSPTPPGTAVVLKDTKDPSLTNMWLHDAANYAIRGTNVAGLTLAGSVIDGTNGTNATTPFDDSAVRIDNLTGSASVSDSAISGGYEDNVRIVNASGSLDRITFSGDTFGLNSTAGGNDSLSLESTATADVFKATVQNSAFTGAAGDLVGFQHAGSGAGDLVLTGDAFSNDHPAIATGGGGLSLVSDGGAGPTTMTITANSFRDAVGPAVLIAKTTGPSTQTGTFTQNTIGVGGVANSGSAEGPGLKLQTLGQGATTWAVSGNDIRGYNTNGIEVLDGGAASAQGGTSDTTITGNVIAEPGTTPGTLSIPKQGVHLNIGTVPGDAYAACAVIAQNALVDSGADSVPSTIDVDVRLRQRQNTTVRLPGYGGTSFDTAAVQSFVSGANTGGPTVLAQSSGSGGGYSGAGTSCP